MTPRLPPLTCTVVCAVDGAVLAKRIERDPAGGFTVREFDNATWFTLRSVTAPDLRTFGCILYRVARNSRMAIVRGDPLPHVQSGKAYMRRARRSDGTNALTDCARAWIAVDMDDAPLPPRLDWRDPEAVALYLQTLLPPELRGVDCLLVWSAKMGFRVAGLARCKLFYALTAPVSDSDLRAWAMAWNRQQGAKLIDPKLFNPVQPHYLANPILAAGIADPLAGIGRWHWVPGIFTERATLTLPASPPVPSWDASQAPTGGGFANRLLAIGDPDEGFYEPITAAIGAAVRMGLSRADTIAAVRKVVLAADPGGRTPEEIRRYASDRFIGDAYTSFARNDAARRQAEDGQEFKVELSARTVARNRRHSQDLANYVALKRAVTAAAAAAADAATENTEGDAP
jgi:hypothetical protein